MDDARRNDVAERAKAIYEERIRPLVEKEHLGEDLLIDVDTGDYEIAQGREGYFEASRRLEERHPGSRVFVMRIGYRALARLGGARSATCTSASRRAARCGSNRSRPP